jgi:hypothetical protein
MSTGKRNQLAAQSAFWVPEALSELHSADIALRDGKYEDVGKYIAEAREHLKHLCNLFDEACAEAREEEGS